MTRLTPDPDLDQLVRQLNDANQSDAPEATESLEESSRVAAVWPAAAGGALEQLLGDAGARGASDLLIVEGQPPIFRIGGRLVRTADAALSSDDVHALIGGLVQGRVRSHLESDGSADFSLRLAPSGDDRRAMRFRVNIHKQRGTLAAAFRALPADIPTLEQLNLPAAFAELVKPTRGLVLVCGPTGAGKSTTLAALVGVMNRSEGRHIITIEDPIEYEHRSAKSVIEQIEIGRDAPAFATALRSALRQDPDSILVGEMRDLDTISTALTAAETGHLILSTLHTSSVAQAINRIVDVFPSGQQGQVRQQLALSLNAIVVQQLIPRSDGKGAVVAVELLTASYAVRNLIRSDKLPQLASEVTMGKRQGMISMEDSLAQLVQERAITVEEARIRSTRPDELDSLLRTR